MRILILMMFLALEAGAQTPHCGTAELFRRPGGAMNLMAQWTAKRAASGSEAYRVLETPHFRISYSLAGMNRIKTVADDSVLLRALDSLARIAPGHGKGAGDAAFIDARLDSLKAPHPLYAVVVSEYLEHARAYYVDTLGMRAPSSLGPSYYYLAPSGDAGKYSVDIVDVGTAAPEFRGQPIYALTFPSAQGGMLMDNDFLYNSRFDSAAGIPAGDTVTSQYQGQVIHNYAIDWRMGLKVTCFHEFYHAVQFTYTPDPNDYHVWYETGAVGMEERNAPEVNDYLQYLPSLFEDLPFLSMFAYPSDLSWYGNGIFHVFLTAELGAGFDVAVWSRLAANGNDIRDALSRVGAAQGKSLPQIYADFASQLAFSGRPVRPPFRPFSPDMPLWPALNTQALDIHPPAAYQSPAQAPLTITAFKISGAAGSGKSIQAGDSDLIPLLAFAGPDSDLVRQLPGSAVGLDFADSAGRDNLLLLANGSTQKAANAKILVLQSVTSADLFAYPNPLRLSGPDSRLFFARVPRASGIRIFSEAGLEVRSLSFTPDSALWSWDLKDAAGSPVKPGVYYYREGEGPVAAVLLY